MSDDAVWGNAKATWNGVPGTAIYTPKPMTHEEFTAEMLRARQRHQGGGNPRPPRGRRTLVAMAAVLAHTALMVWLIETDATSVRWVPIQIAVTIVTLVLMAWATLAP